MHNVCVVLDLGTPTGPNFILIRQPYSYYESTVTYGDGNGNTCLEKRIEFNVLPAPLGTSTVHYYFPLQI